MFMKNRLAGSSWEARSQQLFGVTNGTHQGSVLSPLLFSVYLDDLLAQLRKLQLGCSIGGYWYGACGYADDLILLAPNREVLQRMLNVCQSYAVEHNLVFSTDPVPALSKTKCIFFCGRSSLDLTHRMSLGVKKGRNSQKQTQTESHIRTGTCPR